MDIHTKGDSRYCIGPNTKHLRFALRMTDKTSHAVMQVERSIVVSDVHCQITSQPKRRLKKGRPHGAKRWHLDKINVTCCLRPRPNISTLQSVRAHIQSLTRLQCYDGAVRDAVSPSSVSISIPVFI
jgi:hypothetical protein